MNTSLMNPSAQKQKMIWIATETASTAYPHVLNGECDCATCESKPRIILAQ